MQSVFGFTAITQLRVTLGDQAKWINIWQPLLNPYRHRMESAEPSTVRTKTKNTSQNSPLKISSDSATSSSQGRHRLRVKGGRRRNNLTLPIEFQSHGKGVGPQLTQGIVERKRKKGEGEDTNQTQKERWRWGQTGRYPRCDTWHL